MAFQWINDLLNNKQNKEAAYKQGENASDHFDKKLESNPWVEGLMGLDEKKIEAEYLAAQAAEARALGKTAAHEFRSDEEVIKGDYDRDVKALSDYALAEMLAELRCNKEQNMQEMFHEAKEKAKKEVASSREKAEKALLELVPEHTHLDWKKAFERFSKEATPEQATEKDLFQPIAPEAEHDFEHPTEEKFKLPKDQDKAIAGNGREADERTDVTAEAGVTQESIVEGLGKVASRNKKADYQGWSNRSTWALGLWLDNEQDLYNQSRELAKEATNAEDLAASLKNTYSNLLEEKGEVEVDSNEINWLELANDLMAEAKENAEYERSQGAGGVIDKLPTMDVDQEKDNLLNQLAIETDPEKKEMLKRKYQRLTMATLRNHLNKQALKKKANECPACPVCDSEGKDLNNGMDDHIACTACGITYGSITSKASKTETIKKIAELKKVAEIQSPWEVQTLEDGTEVIARVSNENVTIKESEEDLNNLQK